ncbi:MAG: gliding motility lipoprotein GldD [Flavobacteriaceae bacterium]|nr:gliding motility lipoprotein GldD [Flavobacteriaceae bacterium]
MLKRISYIIVFIMLLMSSCTQEYIPKPREYFRIDLPEKDYKQYESDYPFSFENPVYSRVIDKNKDSCWVDVIFPDFDATIFLTYRVVKNNLDVYLEEAHSFAYKHTVKADAINEFMLTYPEHKVYGVIYEIKGNAASSVNFYATDSTSNYLRGALYFNVVPNKDSLAPVIEFLTDDIAHIIETLEWK